MSRYNPPPRSNPVFCPPYVQPAPGTPTVSDHGQFQACPWWAQPTWMPPEDCPAMPGTWWA